MIAPGWWLIPLMISVAAFGWAVLFHRVSGGISAGFMDVRVFVDLFYVGAAVITSAVWVLYAVIQFLV